MEQVKRLKVVKKEAKQKKYFKLEEIQEEINKLGDGYKEIITFLFLTGLRMGEAIALEWEDIDFKNKTISINKTTVGGSEHINSPKTSKSKRIIYMTSKIEELILSMSKSKKKIII